METVETPLDPWVSLIFKICFELLGVSLRPKGISDLHMKGTHVPTCNLIVMRSTKTSLFEILDPALLPP